MTLIEDEEGADRVEQVLRLETTILPWPVLLEAYYVSIREAGQAEADSRRAFMKRMKIRFLWDMDEATFLTAARLKAEFQISLADAMIAAFAVRREAVLMHKDPEFDRLEGLLEMEALPYKEK